MESPVPTEPDSATWEYWPHAPFGDLAGMIPCSDEAKREFRHQVQRIHQDDFPKHSEKFIHWDFAQDTDPTLSDSEPSTDGEPPELPVSVDASLPSVTGFYRFNMTAPVDPSVGWIIGSGRRGIDVEFILGSNVPHLHARHLRIVRSSSSGALIAVSDRRSFMVDSHLLRKDALNPSQPAHEFQRVLDHGSVLSIGALCYKIVMHPVDPTADGEQLSSQNWSPDPSGFLLPPTPSETSRLDNYVLHPPFAKGSYGTVSYGLNLTTAEKFAIKRVTPDNNNSRQLLINEVKMLKVCSHPNICSLVDFIDPEPFSPNRLHGRSGVPTPTHIRESYIVLSPALQECLDRFIPGFDWLTSVVSGRSDQEMLQRTMMVEFLIQLSDACDYLQRNGIMHRDIKPENIGVMMPGRFFSLTGLQEHGQSQQPQQHFSVTFYLLDFGHADHLSQSYDHMKGTMRYLAPEVMALKQQVSHGRHYQHQRQPYTHAVDVWAMGIVAAELIYKLRVRDYDHAMEIAEHLQQRSVRMSRDTNVDSNYDGLEFTKDVLAGMLEEDPSRRLSAKAVHDRMKLRYKPSVESNAVE